MQTPSPFTNGVFVGREREMAILRANLEDAFAGCGRLVLLIGEAGIGKTRTASELTTHARMRGARVFSGRCYEGEGAPPFWPWIQVVRSYLRDCDLETLRADLGTGAVDIAEVLPEVRTRLAALPPAPTLTSAHAQFRFFDSFTTFLKNVARRQTLVLTLDDLHWADTSSLCLLQFLVRELNDAPLLIIGMCRDMELEFRHPLRQTLGELARESESQTIQLRGLTEREVASFIQSTTGLLPEETLISAVHQQTEGNPFFLTEVARLLASEGYHSPIPPPQSISGLPIPQRVFDVLSRRLARLSEGCLRVLALASVIGREFALEVLARASDLSRAQILQALEEALVAQVITADRRMKGCYTFTHALVRETLYSGLTLTQRVAFHRQVGEALDNLYGVYPTPPLAEIAHHFFVAAQSGMAVEKAIAYAMRAGAWATSMFAHEEAIKHYQNALQLLQLQEPDEALHCELLLTLGDAQRRAGQSAHTKETFLAAAVIARQLKHPQQLARAALGFAGLWVEIGRVDGAVVTLLEEALLALGAENDMLRARLCARLATEFWFAASRERRVMFSQQALQLARRAADQKTLGYCLEAHHLALWGSPQLEERLATTAEILQLAEQTGDLELALTGYSRRVADLLEAGDLFAVDAAIATHARLAKELRQPEYLWYNVLWKGMRAVMAGQFEEGERLAQQALMLGQRAQVSHDDAVLGFAIQLFTLRREQGRLEEMESALKGFIAQYPVISTFRCALAYLYSEVGQEAAARELFEDLAKQGFIDLPQDLTLPLSLAFLAHVCAFLRDNCRAAQLYTLLLPYADRNVVVSTAIAYHEPVDHSLGVLAAVRGQWDEAQRHFTAALAMNARLGARPRLADAQYAYACLLLTRQKPGDLEHATVLLDSALATARELGMAGLEEKIKRQESNVKNQKSERETTKLETETAINLDPRTLNVSSRTSISELQAARFRREGDYWTISYKGTSFRLKHIRGLSYIAHLLQHPNVEFLVLDLIACTHKTASLSVSPPSGTFVAPDAHGPRLDSGDVLFDAQAREMYRQRLVELGEELEEARSFNDLGRADKAQRELDLISAELTRGLGLGGRLRSVSSSAERARVNVTKGIKTALAKIAEHSSLLEHYLGTSIKTGLFCSYTPPPFSPISWEL